MFYFFLAYSQRSRRNISGVGCRAPTVGIYCVCSPGGGTSDQQGRKNAYRRTFSREYAADCLKIILLLLYGAHKRGNRLL